MDIHAIRRREIDGWSVRFDPRLMAEAKAGGWWLDRTIGDAAAALAATAPDRVLLIEGATRLTAGEVYRQAVQLADGLRQRGVKARFALVGEPDPGNPTAIPEETLLRWDREGIVEYWGRRTDMRERVHDRASPVFSQHE